MERFITYCSSPLGSGSNRYTIADGYGTETFRWFLYSIVQMEMPQTVVEIGSGRGVSTVAIALALEQNAKGMLWSVDDGSDWPDLREGCQSALGYVLATESYTSFRERLLAHFGLVDRVMLVSDRAEDGLYFAPPDPVDLVFVDAGSTASKGCLDIFRYYLPRMSPYSSIFIDGASTIWDAFLFVEEMVRALNDRHVPQCLTHGLTTAVANQLDTLVRTSTFTLVHLVDRNPAKVNVHQNGRCWIQIRPCDIIADGTVPTRFFSY
jgi:hypothetical protein